MTALANQMKVARLPVRMLEPKTSLTEVDLAGDARIDHPLERAVNGGATNTMIVAPYEIDEVVGAEMPFLSQEDVDDLLPLAGALATGWFQAAEIWKCCQR